jgi:pimeloyl-ACP methyl ester carboxylesterase
MALVVAALLGCYRGGLRDTAQASYLPRPVTGDASPPAATASGTAAILSSTGCRLDYRLYRPDPPLSEGLVVLGHGFLRRKEHLHHLAQALAARGLTTAALDFCNARPWDGRHYQNGLDMVRVADAIGARRSVYVGFSAGGLAALVAGRRDPRSLGVVALDLVDARGLGRRMAEGLDTPLIGIMGEPTPCNARGNAMPIFAASGLGRVRVLAGAGHCDFESPTDWRCELVCEGPAGGSPDLRDEVIALAVAAVTELMRARRESSRRRFPRHTDVPPSSVPVRH